MQEVVAEEHPALQQQKQEADAVPQDARLLHGQQAVLVAAQHLLGCGQIRSRSGSRKPDVTEHPRGPGRPLCPLTVVVALDGAYEAEELDNPAEAALHLLHEDAGQELRAEEGQSGCQGGAEPGRWGGARWVGRGQVGGLGRGQARLTESMFLETMTVTL